MLVYGKNVFNEIKHNYKKIRCIYLSRSFRDKDILYFLDKFHLKTNYLDNSALDSMVDGAVHQGIICEVDDYEYCSLNDIKDNNTIVILDHLEDPHNFGAIIRSCEAAGIKGIIIPKDRSVSVNGTVVKSSVGAIENVKICEVSNLVTTINELKKDGYFVYAADMDGEEYHNLDYTNKVVLVVGSEGNGVSRLVKENCDFIISIPMKGNVNSLNASVAASILIFDIVSKEKK